MSASLQQNWRLTNIDRLDPESSSNFDVSTLSPVVVPVSSGDVQTLAGQVRQLLRSGDTEGALRGALENAPYGGDARTKDVHVSTVVEVLQSIKQSEMTPMLTRIFQSEGGTETLDVLMKYLYKGMAAHGTQTAGTLAIGKAITPQSTGFSQIHARGGGEGGGQAMSVMLSWHEKLVEIAGAGSIIRVMTDRRTV